MSPNCLLKLSVKKIVKKITRTKIVRYEGKMVPCNLADNFVLVSYPLPSRMTEVQNRYSRTGEIP